MAKANAKKIDKVVAVTAPKLMSIDGPNMFRVLKIYEGLCPRFCSAAEERTASLIGRLLSADPQAPTRITKNFDNF